MVSNSTHIERLFISAVSSYALTFVVVSSSILEPHREWLMKKTPWLMIGNSPHPVMCRMCAGFWISLIVCNTDWKMILPVYGLSYFLATQER